MDFPTQKALDTYMREHPDAERSQHKVKAPDWAKVYKERKKGMEDWDYRQGEGDEDEKELKAALVKLAHDRPELRRHLVPIFRTAAVRIQPLDVTRFKKMVEKHDLETDDERFDEALDYFMYGPGDKSPGKELPDAQLERLREKAYALLEQAGYPYGG